MRPGPLPIAKTRLQTSNPSGIQSVTQSATAAGPRSELKARPRSVPAADVAPDPGIASYFIWMRQHTGLSIHQTAALLHTEAEVIVALEAGAIGELPIWPETLRIVEAYTRLAQVEPTGPIQALKSRWPTTGRPAQPKSLANTNASRMSLKLW